MRWGLFLTHSMGRHMPCSPGQCCSVLCHFPNKSCGYPMSARALSSLTARQRDIVMLAADGLSNKEIARRLGVSEGTVKAHLHSIYRQLGIRNRTALAG